MYDDDCVDLSGTVRIWHANTYRLESTLNYGLERAWSISCLKGSNNVAIGYDEGSIMIKVCTEHTDLHTCTRPLGLVFLKELWRYISFYLFCICSKISTLNVHHFFTLKATLSHLEMFLPASHLTRLFIDISDLNWDKPTYSFLSLVILPVSYTHLTLPTIYSV